jgi:hypothetical protein
MWSFGFLGAGAGGPGGGGGGGGTTTWNPADKSADITLSGGNLIAIGNNVSGAFGAVRAIASASSGLKYYEGMVSATSNPQIGVANASATLANFVGFDVNGTGYVHNGNVFINNSVVGAIQTFTSGDTIGIAFNLTTQKIWFRTNGGNWNNDIIGNQNPATGTGGISTASMAAGPYFPACGAFSNADQWTANFGGSTFANAAPSGFGNW